MFVYERHLADYGDEVKSLEEKRQRFLSRLEPVGVFTALDVPFASARPGRGEGADNRRVPPRRSLLLHVGNSLVLHGNTPVSGPARRNHADRQRSLLWRHRRRPLRRGRRQVQLLSERLEEENIRAVYTSPLSRTVETATILARPHGLVPQTEDGLREISHGRWEGLSRRDVEERFHDEDTEWEADPFTVAPEGGESGVSVLARALPVIRAIVARHEETVRARRVAQSHAALDQFEPA